MRQCYVCGDIITEPVSAYARNICRRCATAPPEKISESKPSLPKDAKPEAKPVAPPSRPKLSRLQREPNQQSLRGAVCVALGGLLTAYSIFVILSGGVLYSLVCGGGLALLIVGVLDLYYWLTD